jgi:hypothetical protein
MYLSLVWWQFGGARGFLANIWEIQVTKSVIFKIIWMRKAVNATVAKETSRECRTYVRILGTKTIKHLKIPGKWENTKHEHFVAVIMTCELILSRWSLTECFHCFAWNHFTTSSVNTHPTRQSSRCHIKKWHCSQNVGHNRTVTEHNMIGEKNHWHKMKVHYVLKNEYTFFCAKWRRARPLSDIKFPIFERVWLSIQRHVIMERCRSLRLHLFTFTSEVKNLDDKRNDNLYASCRLANSMKSKRLYQTR